MPACHDFALLLSVASFAHRDTVKHIAFCCFYVFLVVVILWVRRTHWIWRALNWQTKKKASKVLHSPKPSRQVRLPKIVDGRSSSLLPPLKHVPRGSWQQLGEPARWINAHLSGRWWKIGKWSWVTKLTWLCWWAVQRWSELYIFLSFTFRFFLF